MTRTGGGEERLRDLWSGSWGFGDFLLDKKTKGGRRGLERMERRQGNGHGHGDWHIRLYRCRLTHTDGRTDGRKEGREEGKERREEEEEEEEKAITLGGYFRRIL